MLIQLKQADIETAVRDYVSRMGIHRPIKGVTFTTTRKGGTTISAEVEISDESLVATSNVDQYQEVVLAEPVQEVTEVTSDPVPEAKQEETPPFEPDETEEAPVVSSPRSLFG